MICKLLFTLPITLSLSAITGPSIRRFLVNPRTLFFVYILATISASVQQILLGTHLSGEYICTEYNNYIIFRQSFFHLISGKNLYAHYYSEYQDLYRYSPAFALAMGPLARLPDIVGLSAWNMLNALVLFAAIRRLSLPLDIQCFILWFIFPELMTCLQNAQSNALMAGLIILGFTCMERKKMGRAAACIALAAFIKVYGGIGFLLFIFYPRKGSFIFYAVLWIMVLAILPVLFTSVHTLAWQYQNWMCVNLTDWDGSYGLSVMGWLHTWFGIDKGKGVVTVTGFMLFIAAFCKTAQYRSTRYRLLMLAFTLVWVIVFNHKAESPTYIIAVAGVGVWYFSGPATLSKKILLMFVLVFTSLSTTDIFPECVRRFFEAYTIKALPCIVACAAMWIETIREPDISSARDFESTNV